VDLDITQTGHDVDISLCFSLEWTPSRSMAKRNPRPQVEMRKSVMLDCFQSIALPPERQPSSKLDLQDFYEAAFVPERDRPDLDLPSGDVKGLSATLYPFQRKSVQWLLRREGVQWNGSQSSEDSKQPILEPYEPDVSELPISFTAQQDAFGGSVAVSPLFGRIVRDSAPFHQFQNVCGGILAEEMGLGKTLEVISLILLHQRPEEPQQVFDHYLGRQTRPTKGTLIVTPPSLRDQWLSELARHAPGLKVMHYAGLRDGSRFYEESVAQQLVEKLAEHDVVIVTYDVLRSEIHVAVDPPSRPLRKARTYARVVCPLVQLSWWRVCIDEAQMVENWKSETALMARLVPRVNAWAITGTPVKSSIQEDLRGLLAFLRFEPYASEDDVWKAFSTYYRDIFRQVFNLICLRHTKSEVRKELELPPQKRYVITMPFSAVEEQHYQTTFKHLMQDCGLDVTGAPLADDWNPDNARVQQSMRLALDRLRQMVLHPQIRGMSHGFLGGRARNRPLRTVAEVLDAMIEQSETAMRTDQRALFSRKLQRGQVLALLGNPNNALAVWEQVKRDSTAHVADCRDQLQKELEAAHTTAERDQGSDDDDAEDDGDGATSVRLSEARRRLRHALEIQHRAVFFCGNAYYSIKTDESVTKPESEEFKKLEKLEVESYELAKTIRKEILSDSQTKAKKMMDKIEHNARHQNFALIPAMEPMDQYGIESRRIAEASEALCAFLDEQAGVIDDWREHVIKLLLQPLLDEESEEVTGEEFEESTKLADEIAACVQALRTVLADRYLYLSGQKNELIEHEYKVSKRTAERGEGPCPEKLLELFAVREELTPNPEAELQGEFGSLRGIVTALRGIASKLSSRGQGSTSQRSSTELAIVTHELTVAQKQLSEQTKAVTLMEQEATLFSDTMNARIEFYRQLQAVSDMVADYEGEASEAAYAAMMRQEEMAQRALSAAEAKHRYRESILSPAAGSRRVRLTLDHSRTFETGRVRVGRTTSLCHLPGELFSRCPHHLRAPILQGMPHDVVQRS
jgi:E3 ubiquitin-protein ligase SHPRH